MHQASPEELLAYVHDYAREYPRRREAGPMRPTTSAGALRRALGGPLPASGADALGTLRELVRHGQAGVVPSTSGRYFGYVLGGALPIGLAADWLTSVWDQGGTIHETSLLTAVVEEICAGWLIELFGLPAHTSVGITSGCSTANLTALAAARHHVLARTGWVVEQEGLPGAPAPRVLVSEGCHVTITRALRLLGLGGQISVVPCDDQGRMRLPALAELLAGTSGPLIVCAEIGHVDTGASDDVERIAALVHEHGGWLHLDAAFGMWAAASPRTRARVAGLALADSWATDAHKWLNVPYDCGIVLCAHPEAHRAALRARASYLIDGDPPRRDPFDHTPECSRRARPLVLWATLRHLGAGGVAELVERSCRLAGHIAGRLAAEPGVRVLNEVALNQVLVRFGGDDAHTEEVITALQDSGVAYASGTTWRGEKALRVSVCNWQTGEADCDALVDTLIAAHREGLDLPGRGAPSAPLGWSDRRVQAGEQH